MPKLLKSQKGRMIEFLLDIKINNDDRFNQIMLDMYDETASEVEKAYPEIEPFSKDYPAIVIPAINDKLFEYFRKENLFKDSIFMYHKLRESIINWVPEGYYSQFYPKFSPCQATLLDLLNAEVCNVLSMPELNDYLKKLNQWEARDFFDQISQIFAMLEPVRNTLMQQHPELDIQIDSYQKHILTIITLYLIDKEKSEKSRADFKESIASAFDVFRKLLDDNLTSKLTDIMMPVVFSSRAAHRIAKFSNDKKEIMPFSWYSDSRARLDAVNSTLMQYIEG